MLDPGLSGGDGVSGGIGWHTFRDQGRAEKLLGVFAIGYGKNQVLCSPKEQALNALVARKDGFTYPLRRSCDRKMLVTTDVTARLLKECGLKAGNLRMTLALCLLQLYDLVRSCGVDWAELIPP
eukprot:scaffold183774_cov17-Tisochrysis_lutea.AAC.2